MHMLDIICEHFTQSIVKISFESWQIENDAMYGNDGSLETLPDRVNVDVLRLDGVYSTRQVPGQEFVDGMLAENSPGLIDTVPHGQIGFGAFWVFGKPCKF